MSKTYQYRKHVRWGQYVIAILFLILVVSFMFATVNLYHLYQELNPSTPFPLLPLVPLICIVIIFVAEGVFLWYLFYRLAGVQVIVESDVITYKHRSGETKIRFEDITKIGLPSIPYIGGWITVIAGKEKIRLTVVVNEIGDFVQTLKASLDSIGLPNRYDESKLFGFLKTAVFADQSWDRMYAIFWKYILVTVGTELLGIGIATLNWKATFFWIIFSLLYPTLVYTITEIIFGVHIAKTAIRETFFVPARDIAYEKSVYRAAIFIGSAVYLIIALISIFILR